MPPPIGKRKTRKLVAKSRLLNSTDRRCLQQEQQLIYNWNSGNTTALSLDITNPAISSSRVDTVSLTQSNACGSSATLDSSDTEIDYAPNQQTPNVGFHFFQNLLFHRLRESFTASLKKVNEMHCTNCNEKLFVNYKSRVSRCRRCIDPGPVVP